MALRLSGTSCWITVSSTKGDQGYATYVYCVSRLRGLKCPLEGKPGVKPFELCPACFNRVKNSKKNK